MNKTLISKLLFSILIILTCGRCREKYELVLPLSQTSFLVVEGMINLDGETTISLSRTSILAERNILFENDATVNVQGEDGSGFSLSGSDSGRYKSLPKQLNDKIKYRLSIVTKDNRQYLSEFMQPLVTPEIDSISWTRYNGGIEIYVNASDPVVQYYRWEFDETWAFTSHSKKYMVAEFKEDPPNRTIVTVRQFDTLDFAKYDESIYRCWKSRAPSEIKLGSTSRLSSNKVYAPMVFYPRGSWELSELYSIRIRQYGMSKSGYDFFQKMKKNTESLGSIFDAQPSEISGNIHCLTDTSEIVIGHIDVSKMKEKRAFVRNADLEGWDYESYCESFEVNLSTPGTAYKTFYLDGYTPMYTRLPGHQLVVVSTVDCADCTLRGTNKKPDFWP